MTNTPCPMSNDPAAPGKFVTPWHGLFLAGFLGVGGWLRFRGLGDVQLSHFDEGIYALSGLWPWTGRFEPYQAYYSPPLYPLLIGLVNLLMGVPSDLSGLWISALAGTASIGVAFCLMRSLSGPTSGVIAGGLVALDPAAVAFSRAGLTDSLFAWLFLLSLHSVRSGILDSSAWRILSAGVCVGFTWNTKYHGFLPLFLLAPLVFGSVWRPRLRRWSLILGIALTCYLPWAIWVQFHEARGYASVVVHQRGYVQGLGSIPSNLILANRCLEGLGHPATLIPLLAPLVLGRNLLSILGLVFGTSGLMLLAGTPWHWPIMVLLVAPGVWNVRQPTDRLPWGLAGLALWILPAVYMPYLRLWLPTLLLTHCLAANGWATLYCRPHASKFQAGLGTGTLLVGILFFLTMRSNPPPMVENRKATVANAVATIQRHQANQISPLLLLARPTLRYYLAKAGIPVQPLPGHSGDLEQLRPGSLLVVDATLVDSPIFAAKLDELLACNQLEVLAVIPIEQALIAALDQYGPSILRLGVPPNHVRILRRR